jgi:type IV pilus assembly protein PilN
MIRINLLRSREEEQTIKVSKRILALAGCLVGMAALMGGAFYYMTNEIGKVKDQNNAYREEINRLQVLTRDVNKYKAEKEDLQRRLNIIYALQRAKTGPVRVLDELSMAIPGKLWLTSLKEKDGKMELKGLAFDNPTIAQFMTNLEKTGVIRNVELVVAQQWERKEIKLKEFTLTCQVNYAITQAGPAS